MPIANNYGPPGTGKTTALKTLADAVVAVHGPHGLAFVTFTRAAAGEIKARLAPIAGIGGNVDQAFPYVGTIHSICLRLSGGTVVANKHRRDWARAEGDFESSFDGSDNLTSLDTYDLGDDQGGPCAWTLSIWSSARHRMVPFDFAYRLVECPYDVDHLLRLMRSYEAYKREADLIDFEDMLERGRDARLPVDFLLVDEAQDNSRLLWSVIERWRQGVPHTAHAGDPWQAIYQFMGGDPSLFRGQPGAWKTIGNSHRLTPEAASYALRVLREGGVADDDLLRTWGGLHDGSERDGGSTFWLARTNRLADGVASDLMRRGVPFAYLNSRKGPLGAEATRAYRTAWELMETGAAQASQIDALVRDLGKAYLGEPEVKRWRKLARDAPEMQIRLADIPWGQELSRLTTCLKRYDYLAAVAARYGYAALVADPKTKVGTIHSAKGREADHVRLVRSWGTLPYRSVMEGDIGETCVAYVAVTRHRSTLEMVDLGDGNAYPFPQAYSRLVVA